MMAVNCDNISLYKTKQALKSMVSIKPTWIDICINSCCAFTGKYEDNNLCEYCQEPRFQTDKRKLVSRRQMAFFSIKDRLII